MGPLTQEDPIGIAGGLNLYGYANGDPINFSDPFGLSPTCLIGALAGAALESGGQLLTGRFSGPAIGASAGFGCLSGGLATAARIGRGIRTVGVAVLGTTEAELKARARGEETDLADVAANLAVNGFGGELAGSIRFEGAQARTVMRLLRGKGSSTSARFEMREFLDKLTDSAVAKAAAVAAFIGQFGPRGDERHPGGD